jgi:uncharacterized protein (TIGR02996 family)
MNHRDALLQEILANPDDDTPRLVYADYVEEHGDEARADFIRIQCQLARMDEGDARRPALEAREKQLQDAHRSAWLDPFYFRGVFLWEFRRGFVERVTMHADRFLKHAAALFDLAPVREAVLDNVSGCFSRLVRCRHLARLAGLTLTGQDMALRGRMTLFDSPHLGGLRKLGLRRNRIDAWTLPGLLQSRWLPQLTALDLSGNLLGEMGLRMFAESPGVAGLQELDLSGNEAMGDAVTDLVRSPHLAGLRSLALRESAVSAAVAQALAQSPSLAGLTSLDLAGNQLGLAGVRHLAESPYLTRLTALNLATRTMTDEMRAEALSALAAAPFAPNLRSLSLGGPPATPERLQALRESFPRLVRAEG